LIRSEILGSKLTKFKLIESNLIKKK
jgi:hypothetical protein